MKPSLGRVQLLAFIFFATALTLFSAGCGRGGSLAALNQALTAPVLTALTPGSAVAGSGAFTLTVTGSNFVSGAVVNFNGSARATTFVSATQLSAAILASDVASVGTPSVSVTNPAPGGTSNALTFTISASLAYSGAAFTGTVLAGVQPVSGASVQLYTAGTTGNGSTPLAMLSSALITDSAGHFSIPGGYVCPLSSSQLYVVSREGSVGTASANSAIAMISTLGACNQLVAGTHYTIDEATTVATVWAFSQFLAAGGDIGSTATNVVGIANAAATAAGLVNPLTGTSPGVSFPSNGSPVAPRINTLANLLNSCTSSTGSSPASSTNCSNLLSSASGPALQNPDTLDATLRIIRNPGTNVAALYTQAAANNSVFSPALASAPADWTLFIEFTGGDMSLPSGLGIDGNGNIWVSSYYSDSSSDPSVGSATKFSPLGKQLFPAGITGYGLDNIYGLAVDANNNVWIPNQESPTSINQGLGSVTELNSSGQPLSGANGYSAGGLNYPTAIAIDTDTTVWVVDYGNSHLTHLSSTGQPLSGSAGYTANSFAFPAALAIDASHNVWLGDQLDTVVNKVSADGTKVTAFSCCDGPDGLAVDQQGNVWIANYFGNSVSEISSSGTIVSMGAYTGNGSLAHPQGIAIDGAGNVWLGNFRASYLTELAGSSSSVPGKLLSPVTGWGPDSQLSGAFAVSIDSSGNLWVTNFNGKSVEEFVGIASPVKTPLTGPAQAP